jgi:hypothetical protein
VLAEEAVRPLLDKPVDAAFGPQAVWTTDISSGNEMSDYSPSGEFRLSEFFDQGRREGDFAVIRIAVPSDERLPPEEQEANIASFIRSVWDAGVRTEFLRVDLYFLEPADLANAQRTGDLSNGPGLSDDYYVVSVDPFDQEALDGLAETIKGGRRQ